MIIIDPPYVSDFLKKTLRDFQFPVLRNADAVRLLNGCNINFADPDEVLGSLGNQRDPMIYTSSENSVGWIAEKLHNTNLPDKVNLFKDKTRFRKMLSALHPRFFFREYQLSELDTIDAQQLPVPFIIKPSVGFFSLGVHKVNTPAEWPQVRDRIKKEVDMIRDTYPEQVLDVNKFIVEENITGDEFTIDAYYNSEGEPVVLGMMRHIFASESDTSDRLYITSTAVIEKNLERFRDFLGEMGAMAGLRNLPVHVEVRVDESGRIMPIEVNPLRFGGWCTSAELTHYAFGFNPYELLMNNQRPHWQQILRERADDIFSIIILNNNSGYPAANIKSFDYDAVLSQLETPLELRKADVKRFHLFGFIYTRTRKENFMELEYLLHSDLRDFIKIM
ncbi:MAG: ATP-grasp domain-containing protein [Bacteroidales bacterium]